MTPMRIHAITPEDWSEWLRMSLALYPHHTAADLERGMRDFAARLDAAVFIAERPDVSTCGFIEVGSRPYADGCKTSPVGYIEAWYTDPDVRRQGYGGALLKAAEAWAHAAGYREMASDSLLNNTVSHQAHARCGYQEVGRIVQFRKRL
jgi:aminoglycoside 6'-N-acetyltransferase I